MDHTPGPLFLSWPLRALVKLQVRKLVWPVTHYVHKKINNLNLLSLK
jgi:hypothetical protein